MKEMLISILMLSGTLFILIAALGLIRFKDLYSRMHATTKATSFGLLLLVVGVALFFFTGIVLLKAILIVLFIYLTAPLAAHSIARSFRNEDQESRD
ncbi:MAG TPA: monovalent cation/H(+) antiporter subunit G [Bacteroides sp.]|nr:monovalent cation/H(+) antiporter subunit G [Bacteroides sp.]